MPNMRLGYARAPLRSDRVIPVEPTRQCCLISSALAAKLETQKAQPQRANLPYSAHGNGTRKLTAEKRLLSGAWNCDPNDWGQGAKQPSGGAPVPGRLSVGSSRSFGIG